jgi:hypothetical protein
VENKHAQHHLFNNRDAGSRVAVTLALTSCSVYCQGNSYDILQKSQVSTRDKLKKMPGFQGDTSNTATGMLDVPVTLVSVFTFATYLLFLDATFVDQQFSALLT